MSETHNQSRSLPIVRAYLCLSLGAWCRPVHGTCSHRALRAQCALLDSTCGVVPVERVNQRGEHDCVWPSNAKLQIEHAYLVRAQSFRCSTSQCSSSHAPPPASVAHAWSMLRARSLTAFDAATTAVPCAHAQWRPDSRARRRSLHTHNIYSVDHVPPHTGRPRPRRHG
jgi:hypothetical protein